MIGAGVAVEKQNGGGLDPEPFQHAAELLHLVVVERNLDFAVGQHALPDFEPQRPFHQGLVLLKEEVIGIGPVDPADLIDVAKSLGDEERCPRPLALQDRIDGNRGAVHEKPGGGVVTAGLAHALGNAVREMIRGREHLAEAQRAAAVIKHGHIGERATDIRRQTQTGGVLWG